MTTDQIAGQYTYLSFADELRGLLPGKVVVPGDAAWEAARTPWVVNVDQQPRAVVNVTDAMDIVTVVRFAYDCGLTVAAQPGGHGGTRALDDTILLRTRGLGGIEVDVDARVARVGAGVKWGELMAALDGTGLTGLMGSTPDTTVVGLSVGGGLSWFGPAYGLAADSLIALEVVDAHGDLVRVTAHSDPDLFWALRGGGGDFGIITAAEVALHPAAEVYGVRLMWPLVARGRCRTAGTATTARAAAMPSADMVNSVWCNPIATTAAPQIRLPSGMTPVLVR
jgi:FAD/FMN-containing dehydrogenase